MKNLSKIGDSHQHIIRNIGLSQGLPNKVDLRYTHPSHYDGQFENKIIYIVEIIVLFNTQSSEEWHNKGLSDKLIKRILVFHLEINK